MKYIPVLISMIVWIGGCDLVSQYDIEPRSVEDAAGWYEVAFHPSFRPPRLTDPFQDQFNALAEEHGFNGMVQVQMTLDVNGKVTDPEILKHGKPGFNQEVIKFVKTLSCQPMEYKGEKIPFTVSIVFYTGDDLYTHVENLKKN